MYLLPVIKYFTVCICVLCPFYCPPCYVLSLSQSKILPENGAQLWWVSDRCHCSFSVQYNISNPTDLRYVKAPWSLRCVKVSWFEVAELFACGMAISVLIYKWKEVFSNGDSGPSNWSHHTCSLIVWCYQIPKSPLCLHLLHYRNKLAPFQILCA